MLHSVVSSGYLPKEGVQQRQAELFISFWCVRNTNTEAPVHRCLCDWTVSNILNAYACSFPFTVDAVCFKCCLRQKYKDLCFFVGRLPVVPSDVSKHMFLYVHASVPPCSYGDLLHITSFCVSFCACVDFCTCLFFPPVRFAGDRF